MAIFIFAIGLKFNFMRKLVWLLIILLLTIIGFSCSFWGITTAPVISVIHSDASDSGILSISLIQDEKLVIKTESLLEIWNYSDPDTPKSIGSYPARVELSSMILNKYAIMSDFQILDTSNPTAMTPVSMTATGPILWEEPSEFLDGYLYLGSFQIVDVNNPQNPNLQSSIDITELSDILVMDNYAYLASSFGLTILDISDKGTPVVTGRLSGVNSNLEKKLAKSGNTIYVTNWNSESAAIFDVSDKSTPEKIGEVIIPFEDSKITAIGTYDKMLYLSTKTSFSGLNYSSIMCYDITDPLLPKYLKDVRFQSTGISEMEINDDYLFLLNRSLGSTFGISDYPHIIILRRPS